MGSWRHRSRRSGNHLDTGVNGYESEFSHDVVGILTNLFTQGDFSDAHALLTDARNVVGDPTQYVDGLWTYPLPWAVYLLETGDLKFVEANFATDGPRRARQPSVEAAAHAIADDRTGRGGTMEADRRYRHTGRMDPGRRGGAARSGRLRLCGRTRR